MFKGNIAQAMQMAQRMQDNMKKAQEELAQVMVEGQSGGGMVKVGMSARMECRSVRIDPSLTADPEMLEDLLVAAFNDAVNRANEAQQARMAEATAGLPLPPGMKLPGFM